MYQLTIICCLTALFISTGCTTMQPYRTDDSSCLVTADQSCASHMLLMVNEGRDDEYELAFLEYDDQGQKYYPKRYSIEDSGTEPRGVSVITDRVRKLSENEDVFLIVYVHGWHHSANNSPEDSDIKKFRELLETASQIDDRKVFGVYIGWRGRSLPGFLDYLTFWDRKATAHEIGYQGITEELLEIEYILKEGNPRNRMVTIGHSFGGAALFSALHSVLADRYVQSRRFNAQNEVNGFGDLVLLMNPAFESLRYSSLFDLAQDDCRSYPESQKPRLVILSSYADFPVSTLFQIGRYLNTYTSEAHRNAKTLHCSKSEIFEWDIAQSRADVLAVGHYYPYVTHVLDSSEESVVSFLGKDILKPTTSWQEAQRRGAFLFPGGVLASKDISKPFNPYMNIITDEGVISGHNDIWNKRVKEFVYSLLQETAR